MLSVLKQLGVRERRIGICALTASLVVSGTGWADEEPDYSDGFNEQANHAIGDPKDLPGATVEMRIIREDEEGRGKVPSHYVGFSIEWCLIERYFNERARPTMVNLMKNLGTGVLRIGGSSMDQVPFSATAANTNAVITPEDLQMLRATMDEVNAGYTGATKPSWGIQLGMSFLPPERFPTRTWYGPAQHRSFLDDGILPAFGSSPQRDFVVGVELGNESDLNFQTPNFMRYVNDWLPTVASLDYAGFPWIAPGTSNNIGSIDRFLNDPTFGKRWFPAWPTLLANQASVVKSRVSFLGAHVTDHFYPLARTCTATDPYRCPSIPVLLDEGRMGDFEWLVYTQASRAKEHGLGYRLEETGTAAGRGANGVSNTAASAVWALDHMFSAACPVPGNDKLANGNCSIGATGVNYHNSEVRAFFFPQEGNAYYNSINYHTGPEATFGAPSAQPQYYAVLLFAKYAQGTTNLRRIVPSVSDPNAHLKAYQVSDGSGERLFLINKGAASTTVNIQAPGAYWNILRMTPHDPAGTGRTLSAPEVRIDGQTVNADGTWPGFAPNQIRTHGGRFQVTVGAGEAVVILNK